MIFQLLKPLLSYFSQPFPRLMLRIFRTLLIGLTLYGGLTAKLHASQLARSEVELNQLNQRIEALTSKLESDQSQQESLTGELDKIEIRLSRLDKAIHQSRLKRDQLERNLGDLENQSERLQASRADATKRLGALLRSGYMLGQQSGLRMLISQQDPHTAARRMAMFRYVIEARNVQLAEIALFTDQVAGNRQQIIDNSNVLAQTLKQLESDEQQLAQDKLARAEQVAMLKKNMLESKDQLGVYKKRQVGLEQLLAELRRRPKPATTRPVSRQPRPAEPIAKSLIKRKTEPGPVAKPATKASNNVATNLPAKQPRTAAPVAVAPKQVSQQNLPKLLAGFANNKGSLPRPLQANVEARFGETRVDSGLSWQGVLFGASRGQPVKVVYSGQVVFSDWFRGYGKLMVVDHGDGYMSLYGHNQELNAQVGDSVAAGQVIASASDAGDVPVPGLYFEIRHNGSPDDPLQWIR